MSDAPEVKWPREIWMAELDKHHNGQARAVLSEFATVPRFEGCPDTDCDFHPYIDRDIYDSADKYWFTRIEAVTAERDALRAENEILRKMVADTTEALAGAMNTAAKGQ